MIRAAMLALAGLVLSQPAQAQMTQTLCDRGWDAFTELFEFAPTQRQVEQDVNADGWCRIAGGKGGIKESDFTEMRWRAEGLAKALEKKVPPRTLIAEFDGVGFAETFGIGTEIASSIQPGTLRFSAQHDQATKSLTIDRLDFDFVGLGGLYLRATISGVDFSSSAAMQIGIGGIRVKKAGMRLRSSGMVEKIVVPTIRSSRPAGESVEETVSLISEKTEDMIAALSSGVLDDDDREAIRAMLSGLPEGQGELIINASSEAGFGMMQLAMGVVAFEEADKQGEPSGKALDQLLTGVVLDVTWTPLQ